MWRWTGFLRKCCYIANPGHQRLKCSTNKRVLIKCSKRVPLVSQKTPEITTMADVPQKVPQFYRRVLPDTCISFYSEEGKKIFREALDSGHMECYFKLAAQFRTQDEPAFCGLTTLVIALNALEVDPGAVWKGPWRWYHERMLDCCVPISLVEHEGITFNQFVCLAECNSLETQATKSGTGGTLEQFREKVVEYSKRDDAFLILSYSRKTVNQTGDGHFSPVGGYHPKRDLILILDTARFKYPPHWISLELLWEAMHALDKTTEIQGFIYYGRCCGHHINDSVKTYAIFSSTGTSDGGQTFAIGEPRGYLSVRKKTSSHTEQKDILTLFKISPSFDIANVNVLSPGISPLISQWQDWLMEEYSEQENQEKTLEYVVRSLNNCARAAADDETVLTTQIDVKCVGDLSKAHACVVHQLLTNIEKVPFFKAVNKFLTQNVNDHHLASFGRVTSNLSEGQEKCLSSKLTIAHFVVMFLMSWPYEAVDSKVMRNGDMLVRLVMKMKSECWENLLNGESNVLRKQFSSLLKLQKEKQSNRKKCACHN